MWHVWKLRLTTAVICTALALGLWWIHPIVGGLLACVMLTSWVQLLATTLRAVFAPPPPVPMPLQPATPRAIRRVIFEEEVPYE